MFARKTCYAFVRPKRSFLELCIFLPDGRSPRVRRAVSSSRAKVAHDPGQHRDEVEAPLTDWLQEAYHLLETPAAKPVPAKKPVTAKKPPAAKKWSPRTPLPRAARTRRPAPARGRGRTAPSGST